MISINTAKRLIKRALLSNIVSQKDNLAITPLISGQHGIGKSQIVQSVARDLGGTCITIEGGTLKEGEITGLPYQYTDADGTVSFRFLPYYAVNRIQREEQRIFESEGRSIAQGAPLEGDENRWAINDLSPEEKIDSLVSKRVRPVIVFIDEINRTENVVYKELMNILLTRSVNGYRFPWWVFFVGAMNPSTQNSVYATNEMDPAQLDRFLKLKVTAKASEWLAYGKAAGISPSILQFIKANPKCLFTNEKNLEDEEKPTPSPRGWDMVDTILGSEPLLRPFFTDKENDPAVVAKDMREIVSAKLGPSVATMYFASLVEQDQPIQPEDVFADDEHLSHCAAILTSLSAVKKVQTCDLMLDYLKENLEFLMLDRRNFAKKKRQLTAFIETLDSSTRLLFAQKLASSTTSDGNSLIELLFDIFSSDLIATLDLSDQIRAHIKASK